MHCANVEDGNAFSIYLNFSRSEQFGLPFSPFLHPRDPRQQYLSFIFWRRLEPRFGVMRLELELLFIQY